MTLNYCCMSFARGMNFNILSALGFKKLKQCPIDLKWYKVTLSLILFDINFVKFYLIVINLMLNLTNIEDTFGAD